ncbi:MAG: ABC transporter permease [Lentisphaeria bacterium]|nr:ABC transporter permease [Lentisphaeria bacterium]
MWLLNLLKLSFKQLRRQWLRTILTVLGTACGMFLYLTVETFQDGLRNATEVQAGDNTLVVYQDKRFCPFTSRLPEDYMRQISEIPGVKNVVPVQVIVNNCETSLDTVTFRGVPADLIGNYFSTDQVKATDLATWKQYSDGALVGKELANRRNLKPGDRLDAAGITVRIAGVIESEDSQIVNSSIVHLDFLQKASRRGLGEVTQFNVQVENHKQLETVAAAIDDRFRYDRTPTHTRPEKAFVANTARDMVELVGFTRWLGLAAVVAVLFLITNTIIIAVRGRINENAVMQSIGFQPEHIGWMTLAEGLLIGAIGGALGCISAWAFLQTGHFALSSEGLSIVFRINPMLIQKAAIIALVLGLISGIYPAIKSMSGNLTDTLRSV